MTLNYTEEVKKLARGVMLAAANPYTDAQLKEIPSILAAKALYFWGTDLNAYEVLRNVLTPEGIKTVWNGWPGLSR